MMYRGVSIYKNGENKKHVACFLDKKLAEKYAKQCTGLSKFDDFKVVESILYREFG